MSSMTSVGGEHVEAAVREMTRVLMPQADADWHVPAGSLDWSCWETAAHVAHDLVAYAGQVAGGAVASYLPFDLMVRPVSPREVLEVVAASGRLLRVVVEHAGPDAVAWHWGMSDAGGFAAMGVAETLVHTHDITQGLGVNWRPPESLSRLVVDRLLPTPPPGPASDALLWATGRADIEGRPRVSEWVWRAALS
jgi:uncharacterized protein (TIGR03083 family)